MEKGGEIIHNDESLWDKFHQLGFEPDDNSFRLDRIMFLLSRFKDYPNDQNNGIKWTDIYDERFARELFEHPHYKAIEGVSNIRVPPEVIQEYEILTMRELKPEDDDYKYYSDRMKTLENILRAIRRYDVVSLEKELGKYPDLVKVPRVYSYLYNNKLLSIFDLIEFDELEQIVYDNYYSDETALVVLDQFQDTFNFLLERGMRVPDMENEEFETYINTLFLNWAKFSTDVKERIKDQIKWLVSKGEIISEVNVADAAVTNDLDLVDFIAKYLKDDEDFIAKQRSNRNIFHYLTNGKANRKTLDHVFKIVEKRGFANLIDKPDQDNETPIFRTRTAETLEFFLDHGASVTPLSKSIPNLFYVPPSQIRLPKQPEFFTTLVSWIRNKYLPSDEETSMAKWRVALNKAGKDFGIRITPKNYPELTLSLGSRIKKTKNPERREPLLKALELAVLMGAPVNVSKMNKRCGDSICYEYVKRAYDLREKIETAFLERPFAPNDPLYTLHQTSPVMAKRERSYLRHKTLCEVDQAELTALKEELSDEELSEAELIKIVERKLQRGFDEPELRALAKYLNISNPDLDKFSKRDLCKLIAAFLAEGGERRAAVVARPTRSGQEELQHAVENCDLAKAKRIIDAGQGYYKPDFLLIKAIHEGCDDIQIYKFLLSAGDDPLRKNREGTSAASALTFYLPFSKMRVPIYSLFSLNARERGKQDVLQFENDLGRLADWIKKGQIEKIRRYFQPSLLSEFKTHHGSKIAADIKFEGHTLREWVEKSAEGEDYPEEEVLAFLEQ